MRISLFGGGTDLPSFSEEFGGLCVNFSINLRQTFIVSDEDSPVTWEIPPDADLGFIKKILDTSNVGSLFLSCTSDSPLGSGLGTSAAAAVACINAINKMKGYEPTKKEIAEAAWEAENAMKWYGGKQDQYASVYGGCNVMEFGKEVNIIPLARGGVEPIEKALVLFYIGPRDRKHPQEKMKELRAEQKVALQTIKEIALVGMEHVAQGKWKEVGELLDTAWEYKKKSNPTVSNKRIDGVYKFAKESGAFGGKILGAGSGGHMLFVVDPEQKKEFTEKMALEGLKHIDFSMDWQGAEARIL